MSHLPSLPDGNLMDSFQQYPEVAAPLHEFAQNLMRGDCPLSAADRELVATHVSARNGCTFCRDAHAAALANLEEGAPSAARSSGDNALHEVRPAMRPILAYAQKLNDAPASVEQADVQAILDAGWDERAVVYTALVCGFFNLMNRWVEGLGFESDPDVVHQAGRMLAGPGYQAINDLVAR